MIAWLLAFFVPLPLFLGMAAARSHVPELPGADLLLCLFCAVHARSRTVAGLVLCAATARAVVEGGGLALHVLTLGVPVAVLLPLRGLFYRHVPWQCAASAVLAVALTRFGSLLGEVLNRPAAGAVLQWSHVLWAVLLAPPLVAVLRRLPPFPAFQEREP